MHYLDHAAGTPVRPAAVDAMLPMLTTEFGNPSGAHRLARSANRALDDARETMAEALGVEPGEIVFTSGGTEADNLAVNGVVGARGGVAVCSAVEHHAVLEPVEHLGGLVAPVDWRGLVDLDSLAELLRSASEPVSLVSVMLANNETGVIQPLEPIRAVIDEHAPDAVFHTDAVQSLCWVDVAAAAACADLISVSAHKFGGPRGVGVLAVRDSITLAPMQRGGGQEKGRRNGTQNAPGIVAMAAAAVDVVGDRVAEINRVSSLRDRLADGLLAAIPDAYESAVPAGSDRANKIANICHLAFEGVESEALLFLLEKVDIMASAASSCSSGAQDPSHVLAAMGVGRELAAGSLRLSLGHTSTAADVDAALAAVPPAVARLRDHAGYAIPEANHG
jgi:cysteine desulfurase